MTNTIVAGVEPFGVAVNFRGDRAYVSNLASGTVSVIDLGTETVVGTVTTAPKPQGLAVSAQSDRIYVTHLNGGELSVIDAGTLVVASIPLSELPFDDLNSTQPAGRPNRVKGIALHPTLAQAPKGARRASTRSRRSTPKRSSRNFSPPPTAARRSAESASP